MLDLLKDIYLFVRERKKYWLIPTMLILVLLGGLLVLTQGSVFTPFIYALF